MLSSKPQKTGRDKNQDRDCVAAGPILVNEYRRAIRCPGFLGARVKGSRHRSAGVGDCILLDFKRGFFAVADASDRNPLASREFMVMFSGMLKNMENLNPHRVFNPLEITNIQGQLADESQQLLAALPFRAGTTFTGVLIVTGSDSKIGIVLHSGDSLMLLYDVEKQTACQFTNNNFWMVGRSERFFQIEVLPIHPEMRLLLATDGINDIPTPTGCARDEMILDLFETSCVDEVPDRLLHDDHTSKGRWDDAAIIAINPFQAVPLKGTLIVGGTSREEEIMFEEKRKKALIEDQYKALSLSDKDDNVVLSASLQG